MPQRRAGPTLYQLSYIPILDYLVGVLSPVSPVSRCGLVVRRLAGKQKDLGSIRFGSPFSSLQKLWFMDNVL